MDVVGGIVIFGLLGFLGYVLGIVGFFRAGSAHAELNELRAEFRKFASSIQPPADSVARTSGGLPEDAGQQEIAPEPPQAHIERAAPPPMPPMPPPELLDPAPRPSQKLDVESLLTMRLGVWLGSAALLLAGVFLVRYAVEHSFLGPAFRCTLAALLGFALLAGAEWLTRHPGPDLPGLLQADQAPAGLAAGGIAMLFGASYGAGPYYGLLPSFVAFAAMAVCSFVGLASALRYGPLTAAIGIIGAFATPALVTTDNPALPGLFAYLIVVSIAAHLVVRHTAWTWLGWATVIAGAAWVCIAATTDAPGLWAAAAFVPAMAALNLALLPAAALDHPLGRRLAWGPFAVIAAAGLVLEQSAPDSTTRIALFLLSPIAVWKGVTEPRLDRLPWLASLIGLLALLLWGLPAWPYGIAGVAERGGPPPLEPTDVRAFLGAAVIFAGFYAAAGLVLERLAPHPLRWAALVAAVPILTLAAAFVQVTRFHPETSWDIAALLLSVGLTFVAVRAANDHSPQRAGVHAAGAVAALALGCAMIFRDQWLTLSIALFLPALAWIEAKADLPPLRTVAMTVATLVLVRLALNWYVLDYAYGSTKLANGLVLAYAFPAAAFAYAAHLFRRRADDLLVAILQAGAVTFAAYFLAFEIRHWFGDGNLEGPFTFDEIAIHVLTLSVQAWVYLFVAQRTGSATFDKIWRILGAGALTLAAWLLVFNPGLTGARCETFSLFAAYLAPAAMALHARGRLTESELRPLLGGYALISGFVWITLQVHHAFNTDRMNRFDLSEAELWAWSGAWLAYGLALMVYGIRANERPLRLAALGITSLVCVKVFLVDMGELTGLWRVVSFLGLGLALIGLGAVHRRFVLPLESGPDASRNPAAEDPEAPQPS